MHRSPAASSSDDSASVWHQMIRERRELHRAAEPAWCEIYSAAKVVSVLKELGWDVRSGPDVVCAEARLGLPSQDILDSFYDRALTLGADPALAAPLRNGFTGVVGVLKSSRPGPVVAFRFDLDANFGGESRDPDHLPTRDGYASTHPDTHHNCGHDGHTALGLALARLMTAQRTTLIGELRLIFQPAEEGARGARAMVAAGVLDDVDTFFACHLGVQALAVGEIICGYRDLLGSVKIDASFTGRAAHAALAPQEGRNALMAACTAAQALMAIPRHGSADTRVNVGMLSGGEARNTVPAHARLALELRSEKTHALDDLKQAATRIIAAAADMHDVGVSMEVVGECCAASSEDGLTDLVRHVAEATPLVTAIRDAVAFKASDDAAEMMRQVRSQGGRAVYFGIGSKLAAGHHNPRFDFDEASLSIGLAMLEGLARRLITAPGICLPVDITAQ